MALKRLIESVYHFLSINQKKIFLLSECDEGRFGVRCEQRCQCTPNTNYCAKTDGRCICKPGFMGKDCTESIQKIYTLVSIFANYFCKKLMLDVLNAVFKFLKTI